MSREEITNSQDYKATKAALEWWYSLPVEERRDTEVNAESDIIDAYSDGVIYGWNNPNWISVEDELPKEKGKLFLVCLKDGRVGESAYDVEDDIWYRQSGMVLNPTHWMPMPQPPRKED